jgi:DEAD/DEAH box helicase domain-containing protein
MPVQTPASCHDATSGTGHDATALTVVRAAARAGEVVHIEHIPGQDGTTANWPKTVRPEVAEALAAHGVRAPWTHQAQAAALARAGRNVIIATSAASGKSAGYLAAALSAVADGGTALYIAPTKALAADQLRVVRELGVPGVRAACHDGDSTRGERAWAQAHANYLLTNPDMLHGSMLPGHARWRGFFKRLRVVVVDECHAYRGVFGSHVAQVLRRLRRIAARHGAPSPDGGLVFILASATIGDPERCARLLTGLDAVPVTADGSPRAPLTFVLWEPSLLSSGGTTPRGTAPSSPADATTPRGAAHAPHRPPRRKPPATSVASDLLADLVAADVPSLAFVRSRRGAETVALSARARAGGRSVAAGEEAVQGGGEIAAYRSGYLPDDRRDLESKLRDGRITGMATTTALELGVSVQGLDAVLIAGWPGSWSSLWQQAGRAGRAGRPATAVFIAGDDPLDTYLVRHPEALLRRQPEAAALDPANPYVLAPHLAAAAGELPLTEADLDLFSEPGRPARPAADDLVKAGDLRRRDSGWHWARRGHPARRISIRGDGAARPVRIVEESTGRLVGTMDEASAHRLAHDGAVYLHQGEIYLVRCLDLADRVALVECHDPGYATRARDIADIKVINAIRNASMGEAHATFGDVRVTRQVVSYATIRPDDTFRAFRAPQTPLSLPRRELVTRAFWLTIPASAPGKLGVSDVPGAAHAVEHAAISLLPLFASCDQRDVEGVWVADPDGAFSVYVYDAHQGGAGFAERGFHAARDWARATVEAIEGCPCEAGCPSCVQSARCGSGNSPLSKADASRLLTGLLADDSGTL